jgi:hypothetical protein
MESQAASVVFYEHKLIHRKYPRLQMRTVKELIDGKEIERPSEAAAVDMTFKKAPRAEAKGHEQTWLNL